MNKKLKMFMKYSKAQVIVNVHESPDKIMENVIVMLNYYWEAGIGFHIPMGTCKLRLYSLEDMTEEDRDEIDNLTIYDKAFLEIGTIVNFRHYSMSVMDWLREHNYDIDNLIEKGWAERIER